MVVQIKFNYTFDHLLCLSNELQHLLIVLFEMDDDAELVVN